MQPYQAKEVKQRDNEKYYPLVQRWPKMGVDKTRNTEHSGTSWKMNKLNYFL